MSHRRLGDGKSCQHKTDPAVDCRKNGGVWNGRTCLSPADLCKAKGGVWDGKSCQPKSDPAVDCRKNGGIWNGRTCLNPADACKARGWNWDGKSCKPLVPNLVPRTMIPR